MAMFADYAWKCIKRDRVKIRGSTRTRRLRKKRYAHFSELYPKYRDELFVKDHGMTFEEWKASNENKYKERTLSLKEKGVSFEDICKKLSNFNISRKKIINWLGEP